MQSFSENVDHVVDKMVEDFCQKISQIKEDIVEKVDDFVLHSDAAATGQGDRDDEDDSD